MIYQQAIVWRRAMQVAEAACREAARMKPRERYVMGSQVSRAAISVASNIAEGWARESPREKAHFMSIAQGSLDELNTQLLLCRQLGWMDESAVLPMLEITDEVGRMLTTLRKRFRANRKPGVQSLARQPPALWFLAHKLPARQFPAFWFPVR